MHDTKLAPVPAQKFVVDGLVGRPGVRDVIVGDNPRCGREGEGDVPFLRRPGAALNFRVHALGLVPEGGTACSATEVRRFLDRGDLLSAERLLERRDPRTSVAGR